MLKKIFPPANELTVFVITVTILSMFIYMDGWAGKAVLLLVEIFENIFNAINESTGIKDTIYGYVSLLFFPVFLVAIVFGPLFLPFSKKNLRVICAAMIMIDASIIAYSNMLLARETSSIINSFIAFYSVIWVIYIFVVIRMNELDYLMSDHQAMAIPSCIAACVSVISVFVAITAFSVHWVNAYCIGSILTSILFSFGSNVYFGLRYNKAVDRDAQNSARHSP